MKISFAFPFALSLLASVLLSAFAEVPSSGAKAGEWTQDLNAALELAKARHMPVMLKFTGSDWCGWCKIMEKNVFSTKDFEKWAAGRVVLVTIDQPHDKSLVPERFQTRNKELFSKYGIRGVPCYVVQDSEGKELGRLGASRDSTPEDFTAQFEKLTGKLPDKGAAMDGPLGDWLKKHCTPTQQKAFSTKLSDEEQEEFASLVSRETERQNALNALTEEYQRAVAEWRTKAAAAQKSSPDAVQGIQASARAALAKLSAEHAAKRREIDADFNRKNARFMQLSSKFR